MADVARAVIDTPRAGNDLRLGGANALSEFYLGHRLSADLLPPQMAPPVVVDGIRVEAYLELGLANFWL